MNVSPDHKEVRGYATEYTKNFFTKKMDIRITLPSLAEYMDSSFSRQRTILKDYKYPSSDDAFSKRTYYRDAIRAIKAFSTDGDRGKLDGLIERLEIKARGSERNESIRIAENIKAILFYLDNFADGSFTLVDSPSFYLTRGGVKIAVVPELHLKSERSERYVKLYLKKTEPSSRYVKIVTQVMLEALSESGVSLPSSAYRLADVRRGIEHKGAAKRTRMSKDIDAACMAIAAIWPTI